MDSVACMNSAARKELFSETATKLGMTAVIVEKDFWVTWTLGKIFRNTDLSTNLKFKGGTSLSKVFGLIERFSEDIDLILNWKALTAKDPQEDRSKNKAYKAMRNMIYGSYLTGDEIQKVLKDLEDEINSLI